MENQDDYREIEGTKDDQPQATGSLNEETTQPDENQQTDLDQESIPSEEYPNPEQEEEPNDPWVNESRTVEQPVKPRVNLLISTYNMPPILKQTDARIQSNSAVIGIVSGVGVSILISAMMSDDSLLGRLFSFSGFQVVLPIAMLIMFFWGLALMQFRRKKTLMVEKSSNTAAISDLTYNLAMFTPGEIHAKMQEVALVDKCPLFRRLSLIFRQWNTKPSLQDAMSLAEQVSLSDTDDIRHTFSIIKTFIWALPVLGLIGTVIGIAFAVGDFGTLIGGNVDDVAVIKTSLVEVTSGLSFAFTTTLLGLLGALILTLLSTRQLLSPKCWCKIQLIVSQVI